MTPAFTLLLALLADAPKFVYPVPSDAQIEVRKDVEYMKGAEKPVLLDFYRPAKSSAKLPVVIFANVLGGSQRPWAIYTGWAKAATANGFAAINADAEENHTEESLDALLAYIAKNAAQLGVDADKIVVYAASANASYALPWIEDPKRSAVKALAIYYGAARNTVFRLDLPVLFVRAGLDRPGMNEALDATVALGMRSNAPISVLNHPGGHHGFEQMDDNDASREAIAATFRFFHTALDPAYQAGIRKTMVEASAVSAVGKGEFARAVPLYASMINDETRSIPLLISYGEALSGAKQYKDARKIFDRVKAIGGAGPRDLGIPAARACALDGDAECAVAWIASIPKRFRTASIADDPAFASIKARPDFQELFSR